MLLLMLADGCSFSTIVGPPIVALLFMYTVLEWDVQTARLFFILLGMSLYPSVTS